MILNILERKYRLADSSFKHSIMNRTRKIITNLATIKVEGRSGISRNLDLRIFQLLRLLLASMMNFCQIRDNDRVASLMSIQESRDLIDEMKRLYLVDNWSKEIKGMIKSILMCMERFVSECIIVV